jgi:hypothetical protein
MATTVDPTSVIKHPAAPTAGSMPFARQSEREAHEKARGLPKGPPAVRKKSRNPSCSAFMLRFAERSAIFIPK